MNSLTTESPAVQRALAAEKVSAAAEQETINAWAEVARLTLLEIAEETPSIIGMVFESEYSYDDEGGYFLSTSSYPLVAEGAPEMWDDYEFSDVFNQFGHAIVARLCGVSPDLYEGQVTLAEAKERSF